MAITDAELNAANRRGANKKSSFPDVVSVRYDRRVARIVIALESGLELAFSPKHAQGLENATPDELSEIEVSPSGLGVHFPRLDADLYIPTLIEGFLGSRRWMAAQIGKIGGAATTAAKKEASRKNGMLGGRPRKPATLRRGEALLDAARTFDDEFIAALENDHQHQEPSPKSGKNRQK
jgi:hypothetical protein